MIKNLKNAKIAGKTVLLRVDVNEPISRGKIQDDFRIQKIIPTIQFLRNLNCKVIVVGHLGRPDGHWDSELSMRPVAERIAELLNVKFVETKDRIPDYQTKHLIFFTGKLDDFKVREKISQISSRDVVVLENLRFYQEEEKDSALFAKNLASLADVYVNEAFAVSHHKAASISAVTKYLPSYAGILFQHEISSLEVVLKKPKHPFVLMMGGIKISDKAKTLEFLGSKVDHILLGGGLANSLFLEIGYEIGGSKVEIGARSVAKKILRNYKNKIVLPVDVVVANKNKDKASIRVCRPFEIKKSEIIYDIGPKTILEFSKYIKQSKMLIWNGPLGLFEHKPFHTGTMSLARVVGGVSKSKSYSVVGGGETVDAVRLSVQADFIDHVSTGGGAMLEFLAGKELPGIKALSN